MDVAIIGGGIVGLSLARELLEQGLSVTVFERESLCGQGTSSASLRVLHSGFRYLASGNLTACAESMKARALFHTRYPSLVAPLYCALPVSSVEGIGARLLALPYRVLLDRFGFHDPSPIVRPTATFASENPDLPELPSERVLEWQDSYLFEPRALTDAVCREILEKGGSLRTSCCVSSLRPEKDGWSIESLNESFTANIVVRTSRDKDLLSTSPSEGFPLARAWNVVVNTSFVPQGRGIGIKGRSGRMFFCVGRGSCTAIGTMYDPLTSHLTRGAPSLEEVRDFINEVSLAFRRRIRFSVVDVESGEHGFIPVRSVTRQGVKFLGRDKVKKSGPPFLYEVYGTKFTTAPVLAERVTRQILTDLKEVRE
jgi:glycerol-3-phosphate dehydrogenase